jgi:type II secretory pathway predicted ATPase ExeA
MTIYLKSLTNHINLEGKYYAMYCSLEANDGVTDDVIAMTRIVVEINKALKYSAIAKLSALSSQIDSLPNIDPSIKVSFFLNYLCVNLDKDLVIFFDEADCLINPPLITFLRQIRIGYNNRSDSKSSKFPRSMALVGLRDIRDYLVQVRSDNESKGLVSRFNIIKDALTLPNFTQDEIGILYRQHTEASGQVFEDKAIEWAWYWSEGQPWLVNALADEAIVKILKMDFGSAITSAIIDEAAENLIKRRDVHIDALLERLKEPRVARVMNAVIAGRSLKASTYDDDHRYCLDLGLVSLDENNYLRPANAIYQEVLSRVLSESNQCRRPT